jgi:hypothetical protein
VAFVFPAVAMADTAVRAVVVTAVAVTDRSVRRIAEKQKDLAPAVRGLWLLSNMGALLAPVSIPERPFFFFQR